MAKPTHTLFHVIEGKDGKDNFWLKIGAGWEHKDGDGISPRLRGFPKKNRKGHTPEDEGRRRLRRRAPARRSGPFPFNAPSQVQRLPPADAYAGF